MGRKVPKSLDDVCRYGMNVVLNCRCGRRDIYSGWQLHRWVSAHRWGGGMASQIARFRCRCGRDLKDWGFCRDDANVDLAAMAEDQAMKMDRRAAFYRSIFARTLGGELPAEEGAEHRPGRVNALLYPDTGFSY